MRRLRDKRTGDVYGWSPQMLRHDYMEEFDDGEPPRERPNRRAAKRTVLGVPTGKSNKPKVQTADFVPGEPPPDFGLGLNDPEVERIPPGITEPEPKPEPKAKPKAKHEPEPKAKDDHKAKAKDADLPPLPDDDDFQALLGQP